MIEQAKVYLDTLAVTFDFPILEFIRNNLTNPFFDKVMPIVSLFGEWGAFWIAIALLLLIFRKTRKTAWSMGIAMLLGVVVCNILLKKMIGRARPFDFYTLERMSAYDLPALKNWIPITANDLKWLVASGDKSFPSGHTIACFEACTVLLIRDRRMGVPALVIAVLVAYSRLYLYVHYPSDVIFSVIAGTVLGIVGCILVAIVYKCLPQKRGKYERVK